jgi:DNA-binding transcriptional LysR family regulator
MNTQLELRHLRYFVAVAGERHFSRAAAALGVTQPVVSRQIRSLEKILGISLFSSTRPTVVLTAEGKSFFEECQNILRHIDQVQRSIHKSKDVVSVAYEPCSAFHGFTQVAEKLQVSMPDLRIEILELPVHEHAYRLRCGDIDVAYGHSGKSSEEISYEVLSEEPLVAALSSKHPLARRRIVDASELAKETFVFWPRTLSPGCYDLILGALAEMKVKPKPKYMVSDHAQLLEMVAGGAGWTIIPACARAARHSGVSFRPLRGLDARVDFGLSHLSTLRSVRSKELINIWRLIYRQANNRESPKRRK